MDIVREIFERYRPDTKKLKDYGFVLNKGVFSCRKKLSEENFEMTVSIDQSGSVSAKLMDLDLGEEYINIYSERHGAFAAKLREEFIMVLEEIRDHCFERELFFDAQTKRIVAYLQKQYRAKPEYISKTHPEDAIFCNRGKWFVSIMNVKGKKLGFDHEDCELLAVRSDPHTILSLKEEDGFHEAVHVDRERWICVIMDGRFDDEVLHSLIDYSFMETDKADTWIVPANPKYYDIIGNFAHKDTVIWKQSSAIHVGDIVYIYVAEPYSAILYKCEAVAVNIPYEYKDKKVSMTRVMRLELLKRYRKDTYPFAYLNSLGIRALRGPRRISREVADQLG